MSRKIHTFFGPEEKARFIRDHNRLKGLNERDELLPLVVIHQDGDIIYSTPAFEERYEFTLLGIMKYWVDIEDAIESYQLAGAHYSSKTKAW